MKNTNFRRMKFSKNIFFCIFLNRFASFIEGDSWHVNDQELLEYDSFNDEELHTENEEDEEENIISEDENPE